jgi:hypothetical protein
MVTPQIPGVPDHAAEPHTIGISPKALWPTVAMGLVGIIISVLNGVQENPSMLGALPTWLQSLILLIVPPVIVFLSAYAAKPGPVTAKRGE